MFSLTECGWFAEALQERAIEQGDDNKRHSSIQRRHRTYSGAYSKTISRKNQSPCQQAIVHQTIRHHRSDHDKSRLFMVRAARRAYLRSSITNHVPAFTHT